METQTLKVLGVKKTRSSRCKKMPSSSFLFKNVNGGLLFEDISIVTQNYSNFLKSQRPTRVLSYGKGEWQDFPDDVLVPLSEAFSAKTAVVDISMGNRSYRFDFLHMVVTNLDTGAKRSVAWIDAGGSCFFPEIFLDDNNDKMMSNYIDELKLKFKIEFVGIDLEPEEENEATSNARLVETKEALVTENATSMMTPTPTPSVLRSDRLGHKLVQLERQDEDYKIVRNMLFMGWGESVATPDNVVVHIHRFVPEDGAARARCQLFEEQIKIIERLRGDANVRCAWHGTSKEGVAGILSNGFGRPSVGLGLGYGPGVYLAPQHCSHVSLKSCDVDEEGLRHMVLCRVIMGRMEQVQPGFEHFRPSSEDFDSGVDDIQNPRRYVICNAHLNTHIQAGYLVSFKLSPSQREHLAGLENACSNVDVSMTSDRQSNSTPNLIGGTSNSEPEEHEAISNARLVGNKEAIAENVTVIPSVLRFDGLGDKLVQLERRDENYEKVQQNFLKGFGASGTPDIVSCIHRFVPKDGAAHARLLKFREQTQITQMHRGDANLLWGWLATSKEGVVGILRHGFGRSGGPSVGMAYGAGVYIASEHCSHVSVKFCDVDENDLQHMVYCLIIMGRMEQVQRGSEQFQPSSEDFDSGVDDIQNPRLYVIRTTHMNTHIHPEYLVTFKLSPSQRKHLAGLNNSCGNVDVSITNDQRATPTPNPEERG